MSRVGFVQYDVRYGDWSANTTAARALIDGAGDSDLWVLPELAFSGYDFPDRDAAAALSEPVEDGPTRALLAEWAADFGAAFVAGYPERDGARIYNAAMAVLPDGTAYNYRKLHLFNREADWSDPGDASPPVFETGAGRVGLMICFDWHFPETARCLALAGAQIIAHPSNLVLPWCQRAMFARCIENRVYAITANRIGTETQAGRELTFTGGSQVLSPLGEALAQAPNDAPAVGVVEIDPAKADDKVVAGRNHVFDDRRVEHYAGLMDRR